MSEVEKFADRMVEKGVVHMHVDWGPEGLKMTAEERAKVLNDLDDWLANPKNNIVSRLRGEADLKEDTVHCLEARTGKLADGSWGKIDLTPQENGQLKSARSMHKLLTDAADFIEEHCNVG